MNPSACECEYNKACKIGEYLHIENHILVLTCKDEILNTTKISIVHKKVIYEKNNCLIHIISLVIVCLLLLVVVFINCYYYYTKHWLKGKSALSL